MSRNRKTAAMLIFVMLAFVFSTTFVLAEDSLDIESDLLASESQINDYEMKYVISNFNSSDGGWLPGENSRTVNLFAFSDDSTVGQPQRYCIEVLSDEVGVNLIKSAEVKYDEKLDLSEYRTFSYDIYAMPYEADPNANYLTRLVLFSEDGDSTELITRISPKEWNTVTADIGEWAGRDSVVSVHISLIIDTPSAEALEHSFYIDDICASDRIDREMIGRYLFDRYSINRGTSSLSEDKSVLTLYGQSEGELLLNASVYMPQGKTDANCLRLNIANYTDSERLTARYTLQSENGQSEEKSVSIELDKQSDSRFYYMFIDEPSKLSRLELEFENGYGKIELRSITAISAYKEQSFLTCGSVSECRLGDDLSTVSFKGDVLREEALQNQDGSIEIYLLGSNDMPSEAELSELEPILTSPMTTRFSLSYRLPKRELAELQRWYLAVSRHNDGSFKLIAPPFQVENPERAATKAVSLKKGAKGYVVSDISLIGDSGTELTVLSLSMADAFSIGDVSQGAKYERYEYNGEVYYLDSEVFSDLSAKINILYDVGTAVLIRLADIDADIQAFENGSNNFIYSSSEEEILGEDYLGALSAYASNLWLSSGKAVGFILGEFSNYPTIDTSALDDAVRMYAKMLRTVYYNAVARNSGAKVYLSLTNLYVREYTSLEAEYELCEFIPALIAETGKYGMFGWDICIDSMPREAKLINSQLITEYDCERLIRLLDSFGCTDKQLLFCDNNLYSDDDLMGIFADLTRGFYCALFNERIDAYIYSKTSDANDISDFSKIVKVLDTVNSDNLSAFSLDALQLDDWGELIPNFDSKELPQNRITTYPASTTVPNGIKGKYGYYQFDEFTGVGDLTASYHCDELKISSSDDHSLTVSLGKTTSGEWMGIAQKFDYPENFSLTPVIEIPVMLEQAIPESVRSVPLKLVLIGNGERFESEMSVDVGEWTTLYMYIGNFGQAKNTECIQLLVGGAEIDEITLNVGEINGLSREYNDESLESVIADARLKNRRTSDGNTYSAMLWVGGAILIGVATVITVGLLSRRKENDFDE